MHRSKGTSLGGVRRFNRSHRFVQAGSARLCDALTGAGCVGDLLFVEAAKHFGEVDLPLGLRAGILRRVGDVRRDGLASFLGLGGQSTGMLDRFLDEFLVIAHGLTFLFVMPHQALHGLAHGVKAGSRGCDHRRRFRLAGGVRCRLVVMRDEFVRVHVDLSVL